MPSPRPSEPSHGRRLSHCAQPMARHGGCHVCARSGAFVDDANLRPISFLIFFPSCQPPPPLYKLRPCLSCSGVHVVEARMRWDGDSKQIIVAVDFRKAYDTVAFPFLSAALKYVGLPESYVSLLMSVMGGPILFCVGRSWRKRCCFQSQVFGKVTRCRHYFLTL